VPENADYDLMGTQISQKFFLTRLD